MLLLGLGTFCTNLSILMQLFLKLVDQGIEPESHSYSILLKNLLAAGKWRKYMEVIWHLALCLLRLTSFKNASYALLNNGKHNMELVFLITVESHFLHLKIATQFT